MERDKKSVPRASTAKRIKIYLEQHIFLKWKKNNLYVKEKVLDDSNKSKRDIFDLQYYSSLNKYSVLVYSYYSPFFLYHNSK